MKNKIDTELRVSHFVGLTGVGGVQRNFSEYMKLEITNGNESKHKIYTIGEVDSQYHLNKKIFNILKLVNLLSLISDVISKTKIVHFYNNLTSLKVAIFLLFLPTANLIIHERGSAWNLPSKYGFILRFIAWKSDLILANSKATKTLLKKKFGISDNKIIVIYNGVNTSIDDQKKSFEDKECFYIGFLGRLDTPKGAHTLIEAMHILKNQNIKLVVAGDGPLLQELLNRSKNLKSVNFLGRINNPYDFFKSIKLLVVPSIREPLGNICIEAGLNRVPVLASYVDGIPEVIYDKINGVLIKPNQAVIDLRVPNSLPLPEYVVDPINQELICPMQINPSDLAEKILMLSKNPKKLSKYSNKLHQDIIKSFSIEDYRKKLNTIYLDLVSL
jgi:glycosyltransferase involved in cell wall biosynthesis